MRNIPACVRDVTLASALATMGVEFDPTTPFVKTVTESGPEYTFFFKGQTTCGTYKTNDLIQWWFKDRFVAENPEHPFAYIKQAMVNRNHLLDLVKQAKSTFIIERRGKTAIIGEDLPEEEKQKILKRL